MSNIASISRVISLLILLKGLSYAANDNDHLNPVGTNLEPSYQKMLSDILFKAPANFARIVRLPSAASDGESAISIYFEKPDERDVKITFTKARVNIWYAASELRRDLTRRPTVNVSRRDAAFPRPLAETISARIRRAIDRRAPLEATNRIPVDGTVILFFIPDRQSKVRSGILDQVAKGRLSNALRWLEDLLRQYCEADVAARPKLEKQIDAKSREI